MEEPRATLVLGHALGSDRTMWDEVLPLLPGDIEVYVWEQPGHGNSRLLKDASGGAVATARALHDALDQAGVEGFYIAGLSLGGMVSLAYAEEFPDQLKGLVMMSSGAVLLPPEAWSERADLVRTEGLEPLVDGTMERWFSPGFAEGAGAAAVRQTRETFLATDPEGYAQCCDIIAKTDLRDRAGEVAVPVTLIVGEDDPGMTPQQAGELVLAMQDGSVEVVDGARHLTAVECPGRIAGDLARLCQ